MVETSSNPSIVLFTDIDLDGAGVYYVFRNFIGKDFKVIQTTEKKFRDEFSQLKNKDEYKKIYICDLAVIESCKDIIDLPNVVYINHRIISSEKDIITKNLKNESQEYSSCTILIYKKLKEKFKTPLTPEQKKLLILIDDYDSYELKFPETLQLNCLYWTLVGEKAKAFYNLFSNGFTKFTTGQQSLVKICTDELNEHFNSLKIFKGDLKIGGKQYSVCSTFNELHPSEICRMVIDKYNCDIVISVNLKTNNLSIRKKKSVDVHLGNFAKKLFNGGGDAFVAGGTVNDNFLNITKLLYPVN